MIFLNQKPQPTDTGGTLFAPPITYAAGQTDGETMGSADAPVTLEVYSDFQCPICARLVTEQYRTLKTMFVDTGVLRIVAHDIDILGIGDPNESLDLATGAACAAKQGLYWQYHDLIFWNHGSENVGFYDAAYLAAVANRAGVDRTAWDACMKDDAVRSAITTATAVAARAGINATPTLILNGGAPVAGLPTADALIAKIQALAPSPSPSGTRRRLVAERRDAAGVSPSATTPPASTAP